jgi:ubiquinone biosynthesis protein COQ4
MNLNPLRAAKTLYTLGVLVRDPNQLQKVFDMADALATPKLLAPMVDALARHPQGAKAFAERPRLRVDLAELRALPDGTLGREFAEHMIANGLDPAALPALPATDDHSFVRAHLYETHDVWHVITGFATDWPSEIGLQAFYLAQVPGPLSAALLAVGCLRLAAYDMGSRDAVMDAIARGWSMGRTARPFFGVRWDALWERPLADVRAELGVVAAETEQLERAAGRAPSSASRVAA